MVVIMALKYMSFKLASLTVRTNANQQMSEAIKFQLGVSRSSARRADLICHQFNKMVMFDNNITQHEIFL